MSQQSAGSLDLDAAAGERVGNLTRSLKEPGTLDPLAAATPGIRGSVSDEGPAKRLLRVTAPERPR